MAEDKLKSILGPSMDMTESSDDSYGGSTDSTDRCAKVRKSWNESREKLGDWYQEARKCYLFRDGEQWEMSDKAKMRDEQRPALTFNRSGAMIDAVCGIEINNRQQVVYYPRTKEDVRVDEIYTAAGKWARDNSYADDEESDSFRDAVTCGIGVTETLMDYETNPDGDLKIVRRNPLQCAWSPYAQQKCLDDAREVFYWEWIKKEEVEKRWGVEVYYSGDPNLQTSSVEHQGDKILVYSEDSLPDDKLKGQVLVLHYQCYELEPIYRAVDPFSQQEMQWDEAGFKAMGEKLKAVGMEFSSNPTAPNQIKFITQKMRVYYRGFYCGDQELDWGKLPVKDSRGFTFRFITGKRDHIRKMWYGLMRPMIDPQQWGNKFLSLAVDIMARNAKGGVFVEEMALKEPKKAEEDWATPSPFIMLNEGGLAKVRERQPAQYPAGWDRLMQFSFDALHWVTGLNPEIMGMAEKVQAGVTEDARRRSAIAILAPLFDSLKRYRKSQGYLMLAYIREFLSDGRIMRITGNKGDMQLIPLIRRDDTVEYDVVVSEAPSSPDFREKVWSGLQPLLGALAKQGIPIPASVIQYAPGIPSDVAQELQQAMEGKPPPQLMAQMQKMQQAVQQLSAENGQLKQQNTQMALDNRMAVAELSLKHLSETQRLQAKINQGAQDNSTEMAIAKLNADVKDLTNLRDNLAKLEIADKKAVSSDPGGIP